MKKDANKKETIFFTWQSDLHSNTNKHLLRDCLKAAIKLLKKDIIDMHMRLDSDTLHATGSPDIVATIFDKIKCSSAMVADISLVNQGSIARLTSNPNVLIELGYAAAVLGWESIMTFFNEHYGRIEDLPFDLRGRRHHKFNLSPTATKDEINRVSARITQEMIAQIKNILIREKLPTPEVKKSKSSQHIRYESDVKTIKWFLSRVSTRDIESYVSNFINREILDLDLLDDFYELELVNSPRFHFYDSKLKDKFKNLKNWLGKTLDHGVDFTFYNESLYKLYRSDHNQTVADQTFLLIKKEMIALQSALTSLLKYIHENYEDVDTRYLNKEAIKYKKTQDEIWTKKLSGK